MVVANNVKDEGAGFQGNTNVITLITEDTVTQLPLMDKEEAAHAILDRIMQLR
jgi:phosphopantothenoylcysteine decarboxylase/phosphopantothenate--cysteine ligase